MSYRYGYFPDRPKSRRAWSGVRALVVAALFAVAGHAAADYDVAIAPVGAIDLAPGAFVLDATGAWVIGNVGARYASNGSLVAGFISDLANRPRLIVETLDGGFVDADVLPYGGFVGFCRLVKHGAWSLQVADSAPCDSLGADGAGTIWITTRADIDTDPVSVYRVGSHGVGLAGPLALPANFVALSLGASGSSGSYVAGYDSATSQPSIVALDTHGAVRWQFTDTTGNGEFTQIGVDPAGNVHAAGQAADKTLVAAALTSAGSAIRVTRVAVPGADRTSGFAIAADGSTFNYVPAIDGSKRELQKFDPTAIPIGQADVPVQGVGSYSSEVAGHFAVRIAPNGDILVLDDTGTNAAPATSLTLVRFNSAGVVANTTTIPGDAGAAAIYTNTLAAMADSSALLSVYSAPAPADFDNTYPQTGRFVHVDTSGAIVANPFQTTGVAAALNASVDSAIADDGSTYVLANDVSNPVGPQAPGAYESNIVLTAIAPNGVQAWQVSEAGWVYGKLAANTDNVCVFGIFAPYESDSYTYPSDDTPVVRIECHDAATGAVTFDNAFPAATFDAAHFADDGSLLVVFETPHSAAPNGIGIGVSKVDMSGNVIASHTADTDALLIAACSDGSFGLVANDTSAVVTRIAPDGSVAWSHPLPGTGATYARVDCLADGSFLLQGIVTANAYGATLVDASGSVAWTKTLVADAPTNFYQAGNAVGDASSVYVAYEVIHYGDSEPGGGVIYGPETWAPAIARLDRGSGAVLWSKDFEPVQQNGVVLDPATGTPVYYGAIYSRVTLHTLDAATGTTNATRQLACETYACGSAGAIQNAAITDDGTLHYVVTAYGDGGSDVPHVVGVDDIVSAPPSIEVAQQGLSGIWYAPYESGQGFGIDIASSGSIFVSWFTYEPAALDATGGNDPAALNWYSMQGSAASGDDSSSLTIYANTGGAFASGATSAVAVGTATLRFVDCSHGAIDYTFAATGSAAAGLSGTIDVVRLTTGFGPCNSNGSTSGGATSADAGFDSNQSGAWYDPSMSGQGLELSVTPASGTGAGLLFGAWFTFDPASASDDPTTQHWFTLQADFAAATNGTVVVPIYSSLGGTFDASPASTTNRVGEGTLTFDGCSSATFAYRFDDTLLAGAYAGLDGELQLVPLTACQ